jgi:hypothetical protein
MQRKVIKEEEVPSASRVFTWLHCSVGPELTHEEEEENLTQVRIFWLHHLHGCHPLKLTSLS